MDEIYCEYRKSWGEILETDYAAHDFKAKIIQIFHDEGWLHVADKSYPITFGGLYYINGQQRYSIEFDEIKEFRQSSVMIASKLLRTLAELLDFEKEYKKLFNDGGNYLPVVHHKTIDSQFKEINSLYDSGRSYAKPLLVSKTLDLISYGVYGKLYEY